MESEDSIEVRFRYADLPLRKLFNKVQLMNRGSKALSILLAVIMWIAVLIAVLGLLSLRDEYRMEGVEATLFGFSLGVLITLLVLILLNKPRYRRMIDAICQSPSRKDGLRMVLDRQGLRVFGTGHQVFQSWSSVEKVVSVQDVTLIMPSRCEFYPLPHNCLPAGLNPDELARRIVAWRAAA